MYQTTIPAVYQAPALLGIVPILVLLLGESRQAVVGVGTRFRQCTRGSIEDAL